MQKNTTKLSKGLSIEEDLYNRTLARAKAEGRSFSFIACRAIAHDLEHRTVQPDPVPPAPPPDDQLFTKDVAAALKISVATVVRRAGTPGDVLHSARLRVARKKPFAFSRSKILALERGLIT
jgi:hypothetical protein